jgi:hypothetical protein
LYRFKLFVDDYTVPIAAAASLLFLVGAVYFSMLLINGADSTIATSAGFSPDENVASGNVRYEMDRTPDEIIYKYYVIDTVKPEDLESGVFLNSAGGGQGQAQTSQVANIISF